MTNFNDDGTHSFPVTGWAPPGEVLPVIAWVDVSAEDVTIRTHPTTVGLEPEETEIAYWHIDEVKEDPSVAFTIAEAISIVFEHGTQSLCTHLGKTLFCSGKVANVPPRTRGQETVNDDYNKKLKLECDGTCGDDECAAFQDQQKHSALREIKDLFGAVEVAPRYYAFQNYENRWYIIGHDDLYLLVEGHRAGEKLTRSIAEDYAKPAPAWWDPKRSIGYVLSGDPDGVRTFLNNIVPVGKRSRVIQCLVLNYEKGVAIATPALDAELQCHECGRDFSNAAEDSDIFQNAPCPGCMPFEEVAQH